MQTRSKCFALDVIKMCDDLPKKKSSDVISYQIIKSATSQAANYRAACRARSGAEFLSKMFIVVEEADETSFWLEMRHDSDLIDESKFQKLFKESGGIIENIFKCKKKC